MSGWNPPPADGPADDPERGDPSHGPGYEPGGPGWGQADRPAHPDYGPRHGEGDPGRAGPGGPGPGEPWQPYAPPGDYPAPSGDYPPPGGFGPPGYPQGGPPPGYGQGPGPYGGPGAPGEPGPYAPYPPPGQPGPYGDPGQGGQFGPPGGPPPGGPYGQPEGYAGHDPYGQPTQFGAPPPYPERKSRKGLILALAAGGAGLLAVLIVGGYLLMGGGPQHRIDTPQSAGGLTKLANPPDIPGLERQKQQLKEESDGHLTDVKHAVYRNGSGVRYLFLGGTTDRNEGAGNFIDGFTDEMKENEGTVVTKVEPGEGGGEAACAQIDVQQQKVVICMWATDNSFGQLIPLAPDQDVKQLADLMRKMRVDIESEV